MIKFFSIVALIISSFHVCQASDKLEEVKSKYNRDMLGHESYYFDNNFLDEKEESHNPDNNLKSIAALERLSSFFNMKGYANVPVMTREGFIKNNEDFNSTLFHALNASISLLSTYIKYAQNDDSYEWTFKNSFIFDNKGEKLPIEGNADIILDNHGPIPTIGRVMHVQLYEVERQKIGLELVNLWTLCVFWKKNMFPGESMSSYNSYNTHAFKSQIEKLGDEYQKRLERIPLSNKETYTPSHAMSEIMNKIYKSMPSQLHTFIKISKESTISNTENKLKEDKRIIYNKEKIFNTEYDEFTTTVRLMSEMLTMLQRKPFEVMKNAYFTPNLKTLYKKFQNFVFPGEKRKISFAFSVLDFEKLMPALRNNEASLPAAASITTVPPVSTAPKAVTPSPTPAEASASPKEKAASDKETLSAARIEASKETDHSGKEIIYDEGYWLAQNKYHDDRKKAALKSTPIKAAIPEITPYETELYTYLEDNIYKYVRRKKRDLIQELKAIKFNVVVNNSGKGSLHYVYPSEDNPLFGMNPEYAEAYFNLHLPHDSADIIPSAYFDFARSGFENIFGLSADYISKKLKP